MALLHRAEGNGRATLVASPAGCAELILASAVGGARTLGTPIPARYGSVRSVVNEVYDFWYWRSSLVAARRTIS